MLWHPGTRASPNFLHISHLWIAHRRVKITRDIFVEWRCRAPFLSHWVGGVTLTYDEALDYLYSLINYEVRRPDRYAPDVVSLDRPRALMAAFGDPQETYPVIHVTGTKGKGSVSAMCASVLQAAGLRVGLYS